MGKGGSVGIDPALLYCRLDMSGCEALIRGIYGRGYRGYSCRRHIREVGVRVRGRVRGRVRAVERGVGVDARLGVDSRKAV